MSKTKKYSLSKIMILFLLSFLAIIILLPMLWVVISSLKTNQDFLSNPLSMPDRFHFENYIRAWEQGLSRYFANSVLVTTVSVFFTVTIGAACAYGLARFNFKGHKLVFYGVLAGMLISPQVALLPLYRMLSGFDIYNTYLALILPYVGFQLPFAIFLMRSYFLSIPRELEESAYIDGCGPLMAYLRIILPISKPIIATAAIVTSRLVWNEFLFALVFIDDDALYTIPVGLSRFRDALVTDYTAMLAGIAVAALPMIILFLLLQKQFIKGLTAGSIKG